MNDETPPFSIADFEASNIDPDRFDHEAHIYVGWLYLREMPLAEAIGRFTGALRRLTVKLGAAGKYHETISWFFLLMIAERRATAAVDSWSVFRQDNSDLFGRARAVLARYYSDNCLWSEQAQQTFVLPDKLSNRAA